MGDETSEKFTVNLSNATGGTIVDGQGSGCITDDTRKEANEAFKVKLANASSAAISDGLGVGTILNDD